MGQDKWLGGVNSPSGLSCYGVPGGAMRTLKIDTTTTPNTLTEIGPHFPGKFKWLRGVTVASEFTNSDFPEGMCICLPSNASSVLLINPATDEVTTFGGPFTHSGTNNTGDWLWHGGNLSSINGCVYAIPANATQVMKIDCKTLEVTMIGPVMEQRQKFYGGLCAANGCIYGIPQQAEGVLKIDPRDDSVVLLTDTKLPTTTLFKEEGGWMWHGGMLNKESTVVYGFPNNADHVLKVDTTTDTVTLLGGASVLESGRHRTPQDGRYKYLGGACDAYGNGYCFPCDSERVLMINTNTDEVKCIGPVLLEGENKWQNGFCGGDGAVYAVPQRSKCVLRVVPPAPGDLSDPVVEMLDCGGDFDQYKEKFEGGELMPDGSILCIPLRAKHALKIVPALSKLANLPVS